MSLGHGASIVRDGLVLHLDAANRKSYPGSGTNWNDLSGVGNNGTLVNGVGYSASNNGIMTLDGVNDYVSSNYMPPNGTNPRTISVWFNPTTSQSKNLLGYGSGASKQMWDILLLNDNTVGVHLYGSGAEAPAPYQVGIWQNIVFTYTYPSITSFMNGVQYNTYSDVGINTGVSNSLRISIGVYSQYNNYSGLISNVSIYNRALTATEIQQNFEATRGRYGI
tara:strand:+ start:1405 stop:2070 length:666 start_codon:yes stop_codon:yes gene_type:complete